jgi:hypothetical protein
MSPTNLVTLTLAFVAVAHAQDPAGKGASADLNARRLEFMKDSVQSYEFIKTGERTPWLKVMPDPVFRMGKQGTGDILEGAIFLWPDDVGRPEAAAQVFLMRYAGRPEGDWLHEFTSLSTGTFTASRQGQPQWWPGEPGLVFRPVPGAPRPGGTPSQRLRQMRTLADEFRAEDNFGNVGWRPLRMLPTPIARYGKPGATPEDGALFAFVEGTDPEVFLFIEVRRGAKGPEWQYACAPMSCWALKVERKGQVVWSVPLRTTVDPSKPFFSDSYRP